MLSRRVRFITALVTASISFLPLAASAQTSGTNGQIYFSYLTQDSSNNTIENLAAMNPDGTEAHMVVAGSKDISITDMAVSPDGTKLAYVKDDASSTPEQETVYLANVDGTNSAVLYTAPAVSGGGSLAYLTLGSITFNSTGDKIFFSVGNNHGGGTDGIYSVATSGGSATKILAETSTTDPGAYGFALTSSKIFYGDQIETDTTNHIYNYEVFSANLDGSSPTLLHTDSQPASGRFQVFDVSPSGDEVIYKDAGSTEEQLFSVDTATGSTVTALTNETTANEIANASYSPDGTKIVLSRTIYSGQTSSLEGATVMNADGTSPSVIRSDSYSEVWTTVAPAAAGTYANLPTGVTGSVGSAGGADDSTPTLPKTGLASHALPGLLIGISLAAVAGIEVGRRVRRTHR